MGFLGQLVLGLVGVGVEPTNSLMGFLGRLVLAIVAAGGAGGVGYLIHVWQHRHRSRDQLMAAYLAYFGAVELVDRLKIKALLDADDVEVIDRQLTKLLQHPVKPLIEQRKESVRQMARSSDQVFDTRAQLSNARTVLGLLETDEGFRRRIKRLDGLLLDLISAQSKAVGMAASQKVNCERDKLVEEVRRNHPRLAAKPGRPRGG